jgi:hypothetical protein
MFAGHGGSLPPPAVRPGRCGRRGGAGGRRPGGGGLVACDAGGRPPASVSPPGTVHPGPPAAAGAASPSGVTPPAGLAPDVTLAYFGHGVGVAGVAPLGGAGRTRGRRRCG